MATAAPAPAKPAEAGGKVLITKDKQGKFRFQIHDEAIEEYVKAAAFLNSGHFDVVCLQHEFGIFGGEAGQNILELLSRLDMPIVTYDFRDVVAFGTVCV